ncbi:shikimate kinase [Halobacteriovorax sp.]|uniref:shikimate kinase n=1 Tax=Halobacteriovorax sp. TaxID=2020862 RepID=UPI0035681C95
MRKIIIFGNSSSGKSTLAKQLCLEKGLAHLDLDTLAWELTSPPERRALLDSKEEILKFIKSHNSWVIEGCYSDLIRFALPSSSDIIFMNIPVDLCVSNAKKRPWEPHKYSSKEEQDSNLSMLIDWIRQYDKREDELSRLAHEKLYKEFKGRKHMFTDNENSILSLI